MKKMKKTILSIMVAGLVLTTTAFTPDGGKLISKTGHINFFSHTNLEDITANNYKVVSTLDPSTGNVVFSVPMQAFEFEKSLMQKHYNSKKFLDTKTYPKAKLKGTITNLSDINFSKDGTYNANIKGELELHGVTNQISEKSTITVKGDKVTVDAKMTITLGDYKINFKKGKPSTNIAKTVDVTIKADYGEEN